MHKKFSEIINNVIKKHWIIYTIITFLPSIWFSLIIKYGGEFLKLTTKDTNGAEIFTRLGTASTISLILIIFLLTLFNNYYSSKSGFNKLDVLEGENTFLQEICLSADRICNEKLEQLKKVLPNIIENKMLLPQIISNPSNQLKRILEQITGCLAKLMSKANDKYSFKDFGISLVYNFPTENAEWLWLEGISEREFTPAHLASSNKSTLGYLMQSTKPYYFNNRKEDAKKNEQYIYSSQDEMNAENGNVVGSIFCYKIQIKKNNQTYINAVLSISTNQKRFVHDDTDKNKVNIVRENILLIVREHFGKRIGIELSLLFLEELKKKQSVLKETA